MKALWQKILANLGELVTSKTTWLVLAGIIADAYQNGKPTAASLVLLAAKAIQQGAADWGKNASLPKVPPSPTFRGGPPAAILALALGLASVCASCAWWQKHAQPVINCAAADVLPKVPALAPCIAEMACGGVVDPSCLPLMVSASEALWACATNEAQYLLHLEATAEQARGATPKLSPGRDAAAGEKRLADYSKQHGWLVTGLPGR
jgi:hypothetical protein